MAAYQFGWSRGWVAFSVLAFSLVFLALAFLQFSRRMDYAALLEIPPCFRIGGTLHHYFEPGCRESSKLSGVAYKINEDGLRERPRAELGTGGVLVLGDSMVEGKGVEFSATLTQQLENLVPKKFINAGIRSRGPVLQSAHLPVLIDIYKPSLLLWVLNENDADDDKLAYSLKMETDAQGVPTALSTEDFNRVGRVGAWRNRIGSLGGIMDMAVYIAYYREIRRLLERPETGYRACAGIERGKRIAKERKLPMLVVVTPLGPNNPHKSLERDFESIMACLPGTDFLDYRAELNSIDGAFLPKDTHFSARGNEWLAERLSEPLRKVLRLRGR